MNYKFSKFTYFTISNQDLILYNSMNGKIILINKFIFDMKKEKNIINEIINREMLFNNLFKQKFIVEGNNNEWRETLFNYENIIMDDWLRITILPTLQCNFRCTYCYEEHTNSKMNENTLAGLLSFVEDKIQGKKGISIDWFGGEPLLALDTITYLSNEIFRLCKIRKILYKASITSNGYLLDLETFRYLKNLRINQFQITIDGLEETHNKNRFLVDGKQTYQKIINNLIEIKKNIKSASFNIVIRTNVTNEILNNIKNYIIFLEEIFGKDDRFSFLFRPVGDWGGNSIKKMELELVENINKLYKKIKLYGKHLNLTPHYYFLKAGMCEAGYKNSYVIMPDGIIGKCTMLLNDDKNVIGKIISRNNYFIDVEKQLMWITPEAEQFKKCFECKMFASCCAAQCPANNFSGYLSCGYEFNNIKATLEMLIYSDKKYAWIERVDDFYEG